MLVWGGVGGWGGGLGRGWLNACVVGVAGFLFSACFFLHEENMFSPTQEQGFYLQLDFRLVSSCMKKKKKKMKCFLLPRNKGSTFSWIFYLFLHA